MFEHLKPPTDDQLEKAADSLNLSGTAAFQIDGPPASGPDGPPTEGLFMLVQAGPNHTVNYAVVGGQPDKDGLVITQHPVPLTPMQYAVVHAWWTEAWGRLAAVWKARHPDGAHADPEVTSASSRQGHHHETGDPITVSVFQFPASGRWAVEVRDGHIEIGPALHEVDPLIAFIFEGENEAFDKADGLLREDA